MDNNIINLIYKRELKKNIFFYKEKKIPINTKKKMEYMKTFIKQNKYFNNTTGNCI